MAGDMKETHFLGNNSDNNAEAEIWEQDFLCVACPGHFWVSHLEQKPL